jgi:hypothetical protein
VGTILGLGLVLGLLSPLFRRSNRLRAAALASGAGIVVALFALDLLHPDPRIGPAAIAANRGFDLFFLGFEGLALVLAVASLAKMRKVFWVGWAAHVALAAWMVVIYVWLEFFWHW